MIKISYYRGEMETFHHIDYEHTKQWINEMSYIMGPMSSVLEFQVEEKKLLSMIDNSIVDANRCGSFT